MRYGRSTISYNKRRLFTTFKLIKRGNTLHCLYWNSTRTRKDIPKRGISLNTGTLNWDFTAFFLDWN